MLALMTVLMMSQAAFAVSGGTFTFDGNDIVNSAADDDIDAKIKDLEPGDSVSFTFNYKNSSSEETEWYLSNEVVRTLEEAIANGDNEGGYTYKLVNDGYSEDMTIFDSEAVGGDYTPDGIPEGLKGATDATEEYIHIDKVPAGKGGTTTLTVTLDPESQANSYMASNGQLRISYAVETIENETVYKYKKVDTGDRTNLLLPVITFTGALALLVLAVLSYRKDRKDGEEA